MGVVGAKIREGGDGTGARTMLVARKCGATESGRMPSTCKMSAMFSAFLQATARLG